jgi:hypothetical protein
VRDTAFDFAVPFEMFVGGVKNLISPTVENADFKLVDISQIEFRNAKIVIQSICTERGDGVGQVDLERTAFDEVFCTGTTVPLESRYGIQSRLSDCDLWGSFARTPHVVCKFRNYR